LKEPRLISSFKSRNFAFSSVFKDFSDRLAAKISIKIVSSCVLVKLLFSAKVFVMGSLNVRINHFWTFSLRFDFSTSNKAYGIQFCIQAEKACG